MAAALQTPVTALSPVRWAEGLCSASRGAWALRGGWLQAERRYRRLSSASSRGAVPQQGAGERERSIPSRRKTAELCPERGGSFGWAQAPGWEPVITPLRAPTRRVPSLTPFHLRQQEKPLVSRSHASSPRLSPGARSSKLGTSSTTPSASCATTAAST